MGKKNPHAVALGRLGGKKRAETLTPEEKAVIGKKGGKLGGPARARNLTPEERSEIARKAGKAGAAARWAKKPSDKNRKS